MLSRLHNIREVNQMKKAMKGLLVVLAVVFMQALLLGNVDAQAKEHFANRNEMTAYIADSLQDRDTTISFGCNGSVNADSLKAMIKDCTKQNDYLNTLVKSYNCSTYTTGNSQGTITDCTINVQYLETASQTAAVDKKVKSTLKKLKLGKSSDVQKLKKISQWITKNMSYDTTGNYNTAFYALKKKRGNCMGYALLAQKMFTEAGFESKIVKGELKSGAAHVWNAVKIGKKYYYVDTCWMDYGRDQFDDSYFLFGSKKCSSERRIWAGYEVKGVSKKDL